MRYVKVLFLVLLFFFVMLFFVQNQGSFSQAMPLKLDLFFTAPLESKPIPLYALFLICFLIGALCTMLMLIWDRLRLSARLTMTGMRARGFEKDYAKSQKVLENLKEKFSTLEAKLAETETTGKEKLAAAEAKVTEAKAKLTEAEAKVAAVEARIVEAEARIVEAENKARAATA